MDDYNSDGIYGMYYDLNSTCPEGFQLYTTDTLEIWTFYFRGPLSLIIAVFNILVVGMFVRTNMFTPATILFISIAFSDTIAAFCQSLPKYGELLFGNIGGKGTEFSTIRYEMCSFLVIVEGPLYYSMHDMSILLTTMLGIIKVLAMKFPFWFRSNVGKKVPIVGTVVIFVATLSLEMYPVYEFSFLSDDEGWCCNNEAYAQYFFAYSIVGKWVVPLMYVTSFIIIILSSAYVALKLTCCRSDMMQSNISDKTRKRNRQSAINFVLITVIFVFTEILDFLCVLSPVMTFVFGYDDIFEYEWYKNAFRYSQSLIEIGFASNFAIYLATSRDLRNNLKDMLLCRKPLVESSGSTKLTGRKRCRNSTVKETTKNTKQDNDDHTRSFISRISHISA